MLKYALSLGVCLLSAEIFAQPVITSFAPVSGPIGTTVTIAGADFSSNSGDNVVFFGPVKATVLTETTTAIDVAVPAGAAYQPITVTVNGLTAYSDKPFVVTFPAAGDGLSAMSFVPAADAVTGNAPYEVAVSDLDSDGRLDVITANHLSNTFSVLKNAGAPGLVSFADKVDFVTGSGPYSVAAGDIDGDGKPDIVIANYNDDNVSVFKNTTSGGIISFAPAAVYQTGNTPVHVAIHDLDHDGLADLATANYLDNSVSLLRNVSAGGVISFASKIDFSVSLAPAHLAMGDLNQDGKPDIAVACELSNGVRIMENQSVAGTFNFSLGFTISTWHKPKSVVIGDLDGDGKPDLAVANTASELSVDGYCISILRNTHSGSGVSFSTAVNLKTAASPQDIAIDDIDGDSKPDLAVSLYAGYVSMLKNNSTAGSISFLTGVSSPETDPFHLSLGDMDGDGKPDIVAPSLVSYKVAVLRNRINEPVITSFSPARAGTGETVSITGINFTDATAVDFGGVPASTFTINASTNITATVGSGATGAIRVTTPHGAGQHNGFVLAGPPVVTAFSPSSGVAGTVVTITGTQFTEATNVTFGGVPAKSFTVKDDATIEAVVDNGASGDVGVTTAYGKGTIAGFMHLGPVITAFLPASAGPGDAVTISGANFTGVTAVSFGGTAAYSFTINSSTTITAVVAGGSDGEIMVQAPGSSAAFAGFNFISPPAPVVTSFAPASGTPGTIVTLTGDHFNNTPSGNIVYFGATRATVTEAEQHQVKVMVPAGASYQPISILNTDTHLTGYSRHPFIVTFPGGGYITPYTFSNKMDLEFEAHNYPIAAKIADIDGDGKPDMVTCVTASAGTGVIYKNTSIGKTISFAIAAELTGFSGKFSIGDVDGDGKPDILIATNGPDIRILRNTSTPGNFSFAPAVILKTVGDSQTIGIGDLDGDGKPDLVVPNYGSLSISVFRNTCIPGIISFEKATRYNTDGTASNVSIGDLDGDGKPDIAVTNTASSFLSVFRNTSTTGAISLSPRIDYAIAGEGCNHVRISDLDGDTKSDIVLTYLYSFSFSILKNISTAGSIAFEERSDYSAAGTSSDLDLGDIDGDGKPDLAIASDPGTKRAWLFKNTSSAGAISFSPGVESASGPAWTIALNDLNEDAKPDLVASIPDWHRISILDNQTGKPYITSFSPTSGFEGDQVTISGFGFDGATAVTFGDDPVPAAAFTVNTPTSITAVVGSGSSGYVRVTTPAGTFTSEEGFSYLVRPAITDFSPATGTTGSVVTITGNNLLGITYVNFGGTPAKSFTINSSTTITAVVGAGASGDVSVTSGGGTAALGGFTFTTPPPAISSFIPSFGVPGTAVTLSGSNFTGATAVNFGGTPARSFTVNSSAEIIAIVDTEASGDITVTTPYGTATAGAFMILPQPTITSFTPTSAGTGMSVTIRGTHLAGYQTITFGGVSQQSIVSTSATELVVTVGTGASGDVAVTTQGGGLATLAGFTFIPPPAIISFTPTEASTGDLITITGTDFNDVTDVTFGGIKASSFTIDSPTKITATISTGASGMVSVTSLGGTASAEGFIYTLVTSADSPSNKDKLALKLCPNPVDHTAVISYPAVPRSSRLVWMDIVGNKIKEIALPGNTSQVEVNVKDLSSGIYKITWSDGVTRLLQTAMVR